MSSRTDSSVDPTATAGADKPKTSPIRKVVAASMAGTVAEWYEFFIYGTAATLVFGTLFFPITGNPLDGIIAAFATYAVGFIARPLGGIVFGHFGDRYGRKKLLQFSLLLVGGSTFLMGCLPGFDSWGYAAPIALVLLRFIQGFALGGEWGGAVLLISEHSPKEKRGFYASFPQAAAPVGNILATVVILVLSTVLDDDSFMAWGWRVAFWLSAFIVFIGWMIRRTIEDAPVFREALRKQETEQQNAASLREVIRLYPGTVVKTILMRLGENTSYYIMIVFSITYATTTVGMERGDILMALFIANVVQIVTQLWGGSLSDRFGRKNAILIGYAGIAIWLVTFFPAMDTGNFWLVTASLVVGIGMQGVAYAPQGALFSEVFPTRMRYTGAGFTYQVASIIAGSIAPMVAAFLLSQAGHWWPIAIYLGVTIVISIIALLSLHETKGVQLEDVDREEEARR